MQGEGFNAVDSEADTAAVTTSGTTTDSEAVTASNHSATSTDSEADSEAVTAAYTN
ncbi:MAG: hypothetical protein K0U52_08640 [Gammaproteobacteria bacterium]|nr:hypothetical protein [Gammaproteobacteria bacterium]